MKQNKKTITVAFCDFFISAAVWLIVFFCVVSMKKTPKAEALQKAKPVKAKKHSLKLTALQKAKAKSSSKKPATGNPAKKTKSLEKDKGLTKENLEKLGSLSPEDKVKAVAETAETEEAAAEALQKAMTKAEKNKAWSKHNTWLGHNPEEKEALQKATKAEKGLASALFLLRKEGKKYLSVKSKVTAEENLQKTEEWETEQEMLQNSVMKNSKGTWLVGGWCGEVTLPHGIATNTVTPKNTKKQ